MTEQAQASKDGSLSTLVGSRLAQAGGWLPFDEFMALALYAPGQGYYARDSRQFGLLPGSGSDFVTAPELSPLFGAALARQVQQALVASDSAEVLEFGAGSGALAEQLLMALGDAVQRYRIVDVSGALRARQAARLQRFGRRVQWLDAWPQRINGVVLGNEVLDAMPVQLLRWDGRVWLQRGVAAHGAQWVWSDRPTDLSPPVDASTLPPGYVTELHSQAQAFVRSLADRLHRGLALFIDYGFPQHEYFHPQRSGGTVMCHQAHRADADPLIDVGDKDITAHIDFTAIALTAQDAGLDVVGYTSQARFLMNCGLLELLVGADVRTVANAQKLLTEHEMGELFKVIALTKGLPGFVPLGFAAGDRTHTL